MVEWRGGDGEAVDAYRIILYIFARRDDTVGDFRREEEGDDVYMDSCDLVVVHVTVVHDPLSNHTPFYGSLKGI